MEKKSKHPDCGKDKKKRKFDCIPLFLIPLPLQDLYMYEKDDEYLAAV